MNDHWKSFEAYEVIFALYLTATKIVDVLIQFCCNDREYSNVGRKYNAMWLCNLQLPGDCKGITKDLGYAHIKNLS